MTTVAFQGEHGAYSEQAIFQHFGAGVATLPCLAFADIFAALTDGQADYGMLAIENSLAGTVVPAYDLLLNHDLRVIGEVVLRVEHCLLAPPGTTLRAVKYAKSHHQALAQCAGTLKRLGIEPIVYYDTAGAARDLAAQPEPFTAAIASALAGQTYGLEVLARNLEDLAINFTRFFVLADGEARSPRPEVAGRPLRYKTSIICTTRHTPGSLYRVLHELAQRGLNLTKIESRPRRDQPWHYLFYVDFEGYEDDANVQAALLAILKRTSFLKLLGSYVAANQPPADDEDAGPADQAAA